MTAVMTRDSELVSKEFSFLSVLSYGLGRLCCRLGCMCMCVSAFEVVNVSN